MLRRTLPLLLALAALAPVAQGQVPDSVAVGLDTLRTPTVPEPGAFASATPIDLGLPVAPPAESGLDRPVSYTARDSLRVVLAPRGPDGTIEGEAGDVVRLFGDVRAEVDGSTVTAGQVEYDARLEVLRASALGDSASVPSFAGEEGQFSGRTVTYNLRTGRGRVTGARTQIEDGYLLGGILKQQDERVVFAQDAAYTTCELDHPHYALEAGRIKVVDGERVFTGPVQLKLLGIPLPVVLPFGYFPAAEGRRSGPLAASYGQDTDFGLKLENVGWYFAISDYLDAQVAADVGTRGSIRAQGVVNYARRYAYSGNVRLSYGRLRSGERTDPTFAVRTPVGLRWNHNQDFPGGQRLTASVDLQSASQRLVSEDVADQIRSSTQSSVSYSQNWPSVGRSLQVSAQASQDFANNRTQATLPNLSFSQQRVFPFRRGRDDRPWEKIALSYRATAQNAFSYAPLSDSTGVSALDALFSPSAFRQGVCEPGAVCDATRFDYQVEQTVPLQANFSVPRFNLTFGPSVNFVETWRDESNVTEFDPAQNRVVTRREPGFTAYRRVQVSASASTELYGTFPLRVGSVDGLRHTVTPGVSVSYQPDYAAFGYVREVQVDSLGNTRRFAIAPGIPTDPTRSLSFRLDNAFVARTVRVDSTGEETRQTRQVLSLNVNGGVNFAAEREPVLPVSATFTTAAFGVSARGNARFSAYAPDTLATASPVTVFSVTGRPLRLTSVGLSLDRTFRGGRSSGPAPGGAGPSGGAPPGVRIPGGAAPDLRPVYAPAEAVDYDPARIGAERAPVGYVDFAAPWSFSLGLTLNQSSDARGEPTTRATLDLNQFNARLTPNWSVSGSTGLDLTTLDVTTTQLSLRRDLHCWEMAINWRPIGLTRAFSVSLYVKSGLLRDVLRLDVPRSVARPSVFGNRPF